MPENDDIIREFLVESTENLDRLDQDFVALEADPTARERIASIFRTIHTIKGTCGFLGFSKLESVTHVGENLLSRLRDGELAVNTDIITALLRMVDTVREILTNIETTSTEGPGEYDTLIRVLTLLKDGASAAPEPAPSAPATPAAMEEHVDIAPPTAAREFPVPPELLAELQGTAAPEPIPAADSPEPAAHPEPVVAATSAMPAPAHDEQTADQHALPVPVAPTVARIAPRPPAQADHASTHEPAKVAAADTGANAASGIRVDVGLLDKLMNLVGELVLARNQILQHSAATNNATLTSSTQRLNLITTELQEGVMKTRMQPIGNVWSKFPRIVRDLSQMCGKKVRVEMEGKETELDKTIIEAIKDPLTHIVRNSVDHGIESPARRAAAGKCEEGVLSLRAFHEGGQVNIEIIDDGGGIDPEKIRRKALERGLITPEQAGRMSDREATNLIFLPGFSTAEKVTNVSGRGVGMDVVKTNIEKIGGSVDIQSRPGAGTTLRIKIPLTLAIIPALVVTSGGDRFAIPQVSLLELVRLEEGQTGASGIESIHGTPVYRLRGNLLPLIFLNRELGTATAADASGGARNIVVLQADDRQFGLVVDEINDTEEIVVKPLGKLLKGLSTFAGATIMGDGRVALILDVMGLAQRANIVSQTRDRAMHEATEQAAESGGAKQTLLLFRVSGSRRMAIPLSLVARLEEFPRSSIERSGDQDVVQYRGQIMPLISLAEALRATGVARPEPDAGRAGSDTVQVIVHTVAGGGAGGQSVGLVVDAITDILEQTVTLQRAGARPGVLGSAVIEKRVTELLDIQHIVQASLASVLAGEPALA